MKTKSKNTDIKIARTGTIVVDEKTLKIHVEIINRTFDFYFLGDVFNHGIALKIAIALGEFYSRFKRRTSINRFNNFQELWIWIAGQATLKAMFHDFAEQKKSTSIYVLEVAVHKWAESREILHQGRLTTLGEKVNNINRCFDALATALIFPKFKPYSMPKNYHNGKGRKKSLAELGGISQGRNEITDAIKKRIQTLDPDIKEDEVDGVIRTLLSTNSVDALATDDALADAMLRKTTELLSLIRNMAEDKFLYWMNVYSYGQIILKQGCKKSHKVLASALAKSGRERLLILNRLFPPHDVEQGLANFLQICIVNFEGMVPTAKIFGNVPLFAKIMKMFGGKHYVGAMLNAHSDAIAATILMYLVDSGANVSVALEIPGDFEWPTDDPGWYKVRSIKDRAGYKPIISNLPEKDVTVRMTSIEAMRGIFRATYHARRSTAAFSEMLFIHCFRGTPSIANSDFLANRLRYFQRDAQLETAHLTPGAIRVSFLLKHVLSGDGDILTAEILADHASGGGVAEGYVLRWPVRVLYVKRIREFNESLEQQMIFGLDDASAKFGTSIFRAQEILTKSDRTGVGVSCNQAMSVPERSVDFENTCARVGECPTCEMKLVHITHQNLVDAILMYEGLTERRTELEAQVPAKWESVYLPLLAFVTVIIEKVSRSRHAQLLKSAKFESKKILSEGWVLPI